MEGQQVKEGNVIIQLELCPRCLLETEKSFDLPSETDTREMVCCKVFGGIASCIRDLHNVLLGFGVMNSLKKGKSYVQPWALFFILGPQAIKRKRVF